VTKTVTATVWIWVRVITYMPLAGKLIFNVQYSYSSTGFGLHFLISNMKQD